MRRSVGHAFWGNFYGCRHLSVRRFCRFPQFSVKFDYPRGHGVSKNQANFFKIYFSPSKPFINQNQLEMSSTSSTKVYAEVANAYWAAFDKFLASNLEDGDGLTNMDSNKPYQ